MLYGGEKGVLWRKGELFGLAKLLYIPCSLFFHRGCGCGDGLGHAEGLVKAGWEVVVLGDSTWCILSALCPQGAGVMWGW